MSIKSTAFVAASLVLVWGLHSYPVQADYTSPSVNEEDTFDAAAAMRDMKSLVDLPAGVEFPSKSLALFEKVDKNSFSKNLFDVSIQEKVKNTLKDQDLMGTQMADLTMLPVISEKMTDDYLTLALTQRIGFSPTAMPKDEDVSWIKKIEAFFGKVRFFSDPYLDEMAFR